MLIKIRIIEQNQFLPWTHNFSTFVSIEALCRQADIRVRIKIPPKRNLPEFLCNNEPNLNRLFCTGTRNQRAFLLPVAFPWKKNEKISAWNHKWGDKSHDLKTCKLQIKPVYKTS